MPLGGRRVRGYVVELSQRPPDRLKPITGVSGDLPVFDRHLRDALTWAAHHYLAPVSVLLERAAPPNLPSLPTRPVRDPQSAREFAAESSQDLGKPHPLAPLVETVAEGNLRRPPTVFLAPWGDTSWLDALAPLVGEGRSLLVVVATAAEERMVSSAARRLMGDRVVGVSGDLDDAAVTERWARVSSQAGALVVGTPRVASWPIAGLTAAVVLEEGRRAMKDRQTPTVAVRRLVMTRSRLEGFAQVYVGPTPSLELLSTGPEVLRGTTRAWPLVEVIDRNEEPPGGLITDRARHAIDVTIERGDTVFVFTHRHGYAPAYRCATCHELRRCPTCGSRPEPGDACPRCGTPTGPCSHCGGSTFEALGAAEGRVLKELRGLFGDKAGPNDSGTPIVVGTERDLAGLPGVALAVAIDADGLILGSHFRAAEEAMRILARLAGRVRRGSGHRLIIQTSMPEHPLIAALRRGDPIAFLTHEMHAREDLGYPPSTELLVVEIRNEADGVDEGLRSVGDESVAIMGPAEVPRSGSQVSRWLVQGPSLGAFKLALRPLVQRWRDSGSVVRIDVDPLDL